MSLFHMSVVELRDRDMNDDRPQDRGSVSDLRIEVVNDASIEDWLYVHNRVIATAALTEREVRERLTGSLLTVAYVGNDVVGCATVRHRDDDGTMVVIVRVIPEYRRRGFGDKLFREAMGSARILGGTAIETVVLASNHDGLRFASAHGFDEIDRYVLPDGEDAYVSMRLV